MPMFHGMGVMQIGWTVRPLNTENFVNAVPDCYTPGVQRTRTDGVQTASSCGSALTGICDEGCYGHKE